MKHLVVLLIVPLFLLVLTVTLLGCESRSTRLRETTLSLLNTEAELWDGGSTFASTATDAYGHPLICKVEKTTLNYVLEIRSSGPDGFPNNSDDIVVTRSKRHGETTITKEAGKVTEELSAAATSGVIKGIKKGLGFGREEKKSNVDDKKAGGEDKKKE